jgi:hypothetical protein
MSSPCSPFHCTSLSTSNYSLTYEFVVSYSSEYCIVFIQVLSDCCCPFHWSALLLIRWNSVHLLSLLCWLLVVVMKGACFLKFGFVERLNKVLIL